MDEGLRELVTQGTGKALTDTLQPKQYHNQDGEVEMVMEGNRGIVCQNRAITMTITNTDVMVPKQN